MKNLHNEDNSMINITALAFAARNNNGNVYYISLSKGIRKLAKEVL